jgi:hypothetical protein
MFAEEALAGKAKASGDFFCAGRSSPGDSQPRLRGRPSGGSRAHIYAPEKIDFEMGQFVSWIKCFAWLIKRCDCNECGD